MRKIIIILALICTQLATASEVIEGKIIDTNCVLVNKQESVAGGVIGGGAGSAAGAALGSLLFGRSGAFIGGALGGVAGGVAGSEAGATITYRCSFLLEENGKEKLYTEILTNQNLEKDKKVKLKKLENRTYKVL